MGQCAPIQEVFMAKTKVCVIFGGVSNKTAAHQNAPTLYISGTCMFGGVEIK